MADKLTKKDKFLMIREIIEDDELLCEFIDHEIELLDKKASKPTKANKRAEELANILYDTLKEVDKPIAIKELIADYDLSAFADEENRITSQKISAYMKKLVDGGKVEKTKDKKATYFKVIET